MNSGYYQIQLYYPRIKYLLTLVRNRLQEYDIYDPFDGVVIQALNEDLLDLLQNEDLFFCLMYDTLPEDEYDPLEYEYKSLLQFLINCNVPVNQLTGLVCLSRSGLFDIRWIID